MPSKQESRRLKNWPKILLLVGLIGWGIGWRWLNLDWGEGEWHHPDENNLAASLTAISPTNFDPNFYAYGPLPSYVVWIVFRVAHILASLPAETLSFPQAVMGLRIFSATTATITILAVYKLSRQLFPPLTSLLSASLVALIPGLIQAAHFGTTESFLSLQLVAVTWLAVLLLRLPCFRFVFISGLIIGAGLATKISSLVFLAPPLAAVMFSPTSRKRKVFLVFVLIGTGVLSAILLAPYQVLKFDRFFSTIRYESAIARGLQPIFYTRQFIDTVPFFFQAQRIFPWALGLSLSIGLAFSLIALVATIRKRSPKERVVVIAFLGWFLANIGLFVKWTRFITPILPLTPIFVLISLRSFRRSFQKIAIASLLLLQFGQTWAFTGVYRQPDVRQQASAWLSANVPLGSSVLTEPRNVVYLSKNRPLTILEPPLYELDTDPSAQTTLFASLANANYVLIPSRRIFANHSANYFPVTSCYYRELFAGTLGFEPVKTIASFPTLRFGQWHIRISDEQAEETWSVFDHPVIRIFHKTIPFTAAEYQATIEQCVAQIN